MHNLPGQQLHFQELAENRPGLFWHGNRESLVVESSGVFVFDRSLGYTLD